MIVLDTDVLSEFMRSRPNERVREWLDGIPEREVWTTSIVIAEIAAGIALLPLGARRRVLAEEFDRMLRLFADRILVFDASAAVEYGTIVAYRARLGRPISIADAQIAAIATVNGAVLATRNVTDFDGLAVDLVDPWHGP